MGNNSHKRNKLPKLVEISFGYPDFRFRPKTIRKPKFSDINLLIRNLPKEIKRVGIGGGPLRFKWWKKLIDSLENQDKEFSLVEEIDYLNLEKSNFLKGKAIKLFVEIKNLEDTRALLNFNGGYEMAIISLDVIYKKDGEKIIKTLEKFKIPFSIEGITWRKKEAEIEEIKRFLGKKKRITDKCGIVEEKLIGLGTNGDFYPCVALQFSEFYLGNIFRDKFDKIIINYQKFRDKINCKYCCQARSWNQNKTLNNDFLCNHKK